MGVMEQPVTTGKNMGGYVELGNGLALYVGTGVFVTTGTSVTVYHPFGHFYFAAAIPLKASGAAAANGQLTVTGYTRDTSYGSCKCTTTNQVSVTRVAGTDSALEFSFVMIGRARK